MLKSALCGAWLMTCLVIVALPGCGGGGGGGDDGGVVEGGVVEPNLQPSVLTYNFGTVTLNNSPAAKVVTLANVGNAPLEISGIQLDGAGFTVSVDFCGVSPTLTAGSSCSVAVGFTPVSPANYSGTLTITSNDPDSGTMVIQFAGAGQTVTLPTLHINQVVADTCPSSALTVYLTVTDQEDYPLTGLPLSSFSLSETRNSVTVPKTINSLDFVNNVNAAVSTALVLDYSQSIKDNVAVLANMEEGAISFINQLGANDAAEIIKFASVVEVVQPFTGNISLLTQKIREPWDQGIYTRLYDALYQAVGDAAARPGDRRAVILMTDGGQWVVDGDPPKTFTEVKNLAIATGVPIFAIGIGSDLDSFRAGLIELTGDTGGQFIEAEVADDLHTAYLQLGDLLFYDQYVLSCDSIFNPGDSGVISVGVQYGGVSDTDSRSVMPCP